MRLSVSVVSHGHGQAVCQLLEQISTLAPPTLHRVIVTANLPEPALARLEQQPWPFDCRLQVNPAPLGYGANHNRAFALDAAAGKPGEAFAVLNPDLHLQGDVLSTCLQALSASSQVGCVYPRQTDAGGRLQDYARRLPTPARLLARYAGRGRIECAPGQAPDWVSGAFLVLRRTAFAHVGGFDERYRMYCEDVDLCLRLQLAGWTLAQADATVQHEAQRASHRRWQHLRWHLASLWRLWHSASYRAFLARQTRR